MASPFRQPEWTIEEAVLLAQASKSVATNAVDTENIVAALSRRLRCGAESMGLTISQRYRNEEEVRSNLNLATQILENVNTLSPEYFVGSSVGRAVVLMISNHEEFFRLVDIASEKYPIVEKARIDVTNNVVDAPAVVAEPEVEYQPIRKRRPRIGSYSVFQSTSQPQSQKTRPQTNIKKEDAPGKEETEQIPEEKEVTSVSEKETDAPIVSGYQRHLGLIRDVLLKSFPRGFRLNSAIESKRFKAAYKSLHGKNLTFKDESLMSFIQNAGFEYDGKIYLVEKVLPSQILNDIIGFITDTFASNRPYIFYKTIFEKFEDQLNTHQMSVEMLREYLKHSYANKWHFTQSYIARWDWVEVSIKDEVCAYIKDRHEVITLENLIKDLDHLPSEKVEHEWNVNDGSYISNGRNEKFHINAFYIPSQNLQVVERLISSALATSPFITGEALLNELRLNASDIFDNNPMISSLGVRNALAYLLKDKYSFKNNLISSIGDSFDGPSAMVAYCKSKGTFTLDEADAMAEVVGSALNFYLEHISTVAVRVDNSNFVPRNAVSFDTNGIDKVLAILLSGEFLPMQGISNFEAFPSCNEFTWNIRLLESYMLNSSKAFRYIRPKYLSKETITGAIVKIDSEIKTYEELLAYAVGASSIDIDESSASQYLYDIGLIATIRKNGPVKGILQKAKEYRNRLALKK